MKASSYLKKIIITQLGKHSPFFNLLVCAAKFIAYKSMKFRSFAEKYIKKHVKIKHVYVKDFFFFGGGGNFLKEIRIDFVKKYL